MGHQHGHREEDVSIVGEQGAVAPSHWGGIDGTRDPRRQNLCHLWRFAWSPPRFDSPRPYPVFHVSCFSFIWNIVEWCHKMSIYSIHVWPTLLFIANVQLDHWNIQKPRYEPATSCEWFHIVAWFTSKWLQISISTKCCKHSKQVAHVACGRGWKTLSCCATPVGRLYSRTLLLSKKSAVQQFLPLRFRVRLAAGERPASHLSSSVSFIYFHWRKLRVGFPLAKVCMYTYSLFKSSAIPQNIAQPSSSQFLQLTTPPSND